MILAGDLGGTKANLALYDADPAPIRSATVRSPDYDGLAPLLREFLGTDQGSITSAAIGVAGPVEGNRCRGPNLPFEIDGDQVARDLGLPSLLLLNDMVATAMGIPDLEPEDLTVLQEGEADPLGTEALMAPGTGLGTCIVARNPAGRQVLPGEGGHVSFAPRDGQQEALRAFLAERHGRVSLERVVSGPGLTAIHEFLTGGQVVPPDEVGPEALDFFLGAFGSAAGDLALTALARGGVYLAGGIPPKILPRLMEGPFLSSFLDKGRFRPLLERIPVTVVLNQETAVLGAARAAREADRR